jgi:hypothetical protein
MAAGARRLEWSQTALVGINLVILVLMARLPSGLVLWCLGLSHEILIEPGDGAADGINLVLAFYEAVTFIRVIVNIYDPTFFLEDVYDLLRLLLGDARVVVTLKH